MQTHNAQSEALPPNAVCPEHPGRASLAPCERCGRFLCEECLASRTPPRCASCEARARDPLGILAQPFAPGVALGNGWTLFSRALPQLLPIALLIGIPGGLLTHAVELAGIGFRGSLQISRIFDVTFGLIGTGAYLGLMVGVAEGAPRGAGAALKEAMRVWPRLFGARFRSALWILLFTLLLVIPGIMKAVALAVVTEAAYRERRSDALDNSSRLTEGRRWAVFGLFALCFTPAVMILLALGFLGGLITELIPGTGAISNILIDAGSRLVEAFTCGVALAAFYGLKRSRGEALEPLPGSAG